jgi:hypothetical protein
MVSVVLWEFKVGDGDDDDVVGGCGWSMVIHITILVLFHAGAF